MKENWIEGVILDLSKSALKQGRLGMYRALRDIVTTEKIKYCDATHSNSDAKTNSEQIAKIYDFYEHLYVRQVKLK